MYTHTHTHTYIIFFLQLWVHKNVKIVRYKLNILRKKSEVLYKTIHFKMLTFYRLKYIS